MQAPNKEQAPMTRNLKGQYFESCNCEAACPCVFLSPTEDDCTVLVGWHIRKASAPNGASSST